MQQDQYMYDKNRCTQKSTDIPEWMRCSEDYVPVSDKDAFIKKSLSGILYVVSKFHIYAGREWRFSATPSLKLFYTVLFIILTACSRQMSFTIIMGGGIIIVLAMLPVQTIIQILKTSLGAVLFSALLLLPSIFMGNTYTFVSVISKIFVTVSLVLMLSGGTEWNQITAALSRFFVPGLLIFTLDLTLKYIEVLARISLDIVYALRLRSIGKNVDKGKSLAGVMGITFIKSKELSEELYHAMCCRGFTGEYKKNILNHETNYYNYLYYLLILGVIYVFLMTNKILPIQT